MSAKKKQQLPQKKILLLTLCIVLLGVLMLFTSVLIAQKTKPASPSGAGGAPVGEAPAQTSGDSTGKKAGDGKSTGAASAKPAPSTGGTGKGNTGAKTNTPAKQPETNSAKPASPDSGQKAPAPAPQGSGSAKTDTPPATQSPEPAATPQKKYPSNGPKVALVLDDAGHNLSQLTPFLNLPYDLTIAVLPQLAHSEEAAELARRNGKAVILHQPMQAVNMETDPGPGAIYPDQFHHEVDAMLLWNISSLGGISGLNNHEGSLITADEEMIGWVLDICKAQGIYFLDSRTNSDSKARAAAKKRGMTIYERDIFLDNTPSAADMADWFKKGLAVADKNGSVIMIGHVWSGATLADVLKEQCKKAQDDGYRIVTVDKL